MITISAGQAILLLIEKNKNNPELKKKLECLYLSGLKDPQDKIFIIDIIKKSGLTKEYKISSTIKTINRDPVRRYFESHLAFNTLKHTLKEMELKELDAHYQSLSTIIKKPLLKFFLPILDGNYPDINTVESWEKELYLMIPSEEYADFISSLKNNLNYKLLSAEDREKLSLIIKSSFLNLAITKDISTSQIIPLNLYGKGIFSPKSRGGYAKKGQDRVHSSHLGLMTNVTPLPAYDLLYSEKKINYTRSVDTTRFKSEAVWVKDNFSNILFPFVHSISGTLLAALRLFKYINDCDKLDFNTPHKFKNYFKCLISGLLYHSGGHTFHEFIAPLKLKEIQKAFDFIEDFNKISVQELFYENNQEAFQEALKETIKYNNSIIAKAKINDKLDISEKIITSISLLDEYINARANPSQEDKESIHLNFISRHFRSQRLTNEKLYLVKNLKTAIKKAKNLDELVKLLRQAKEMNKAYEAVNNKFYSFSNSELHNFLNRIEKNILLEEEMIHSSVLHHHVSRC